MKLEQQVCSLPLAQRLRELGVRQDSAFYWRAQGTLQKDWKVQYFSRGDIKLNPVSAFTVAELGEMLPSRFSVTVKKITSTFDLYLAKNESGEWFVEYQCQGTEPEDGYELLVQRNADTEADARAKCLIYLIESGLIKV